MRTSRVVVLLASLTTPIGASSQNCPYPTPANDRLALWHHISMAAEAVAPTANPPGRRRAVTPAAPLPIANFIDRFIATKLQTAGVPQTRAAGDEEFLRRVTLDLTGAIPDPSDLQAFVADRSLDKRARRIDQLLASDA